MHLAISSEYAWDAAPRFALTGRWFPPAGHLSGQFSGHLSGGCECGCGGECTDAAGSGDGHWGLAGLGDTSSALTPQAAVQAALAAYSGKNLAKTMGSAWIAAATSAVESATVPTRPPVGPDCSGVSAQKLNLFQTASGLALGTTGAGVGIASAVGAITGAAVGIATAALAGVGVIFALIDMIFAHHAAAVRRDLSFGCGALPAVNNAFAVLAQGVAAKQITPAQAAQAVWQIYSNFMQAGGASGGSAGPGNIPSSGTAINDHPYCNSNCELSIMVYAMCLYWGAQYSAMAAPAASSSAVPASGSYVSTASAPSGSGFSLSTLLIGAALLFGAWKVLA